MNRALGIVITVLGRENNDVLIKRRENKEVIVINYFGIKCMIINID